MDYLLINQLTQSGKSQLNENKILDDLKDECKNVNVVIYNKINFDDLTRKLKPTDRIILVGGDGTINYFANDYIKNGLRCNCYIYTKSGGSGNDFIMDIEPTGKLLLLNPYFENLPTLIANGQTKKFINNVGYGLDGIVCQIAEKKRKEGKKINYTFIAAKLILGGYKKRNARVLVDGEEYLFKNVWICPTMNGRYYGGGMKCAPNQDRKSDKVSVVAAYGSTRLSILYKFTKIFKGTHTKYQKNVKILEGHTIEVFFNKPCTLQYDGEIIGRVLHYKVIKEMK